MHKSILVALALIPTALATNNVVHLFDSKSVDCLAKVVYHESRGESRRGQIAVARTVLNRVKHPKFPSNICAVVYQPNQFSGILRLRVKDKRAWHAAKDVAYHVLNQDSNFQALYFQNKHQLPRKGIVIGNHVFF